MTDEELGTLIRERREAKVNVARITKELHEMGAILKSMGDALMLNPDRFIFLDLPGAYNSYPADTLFSRLGKKFEWNEYPTQGEIAQKIASLHYEKQQFERIDNLLVSAGIPSDSEA